MVRSRDPLIIEKVLGLLSYIYGNAIIERLKGMDIEIDYNKLTGRIRHVYINGELAFTSRASDGYLLPTSAGIKYVDNEVIINDEAVKYVSKGMSVIVKSVLDVKNSAPGSEVVIKDSKGTPIALGRLLLSLDEIKSLKRGIAVKVRKVLKFEKT
ncbi:MAG: pseudouridine synthase [Thermoprotei archaeon ex4572_64]|nr:MAG: pseudouridine synthase [Thermoprotei archaeon ex4572_64]